MTTRFQPLSATAAIVIALAGCASSGTKIDQTNVAKIAIGKTTKTEMIQMFGPPLSQGFGPEGKLTMVWFYVHVGPFGSGMVQQNLSVLFDTQDRVERYNLVDNPNAGPRLGS